VSAPRGRALGGALLLGSSLFLVQAHARAEPTAADKETARRLMAEGRAQRRESDAKGALRSFLAADAIMHVTTTGLEVARAEIDLGQLVEARDKLLTVTRLPVEANETRPIAEARVTAKTLAAEIERRIPSITVKLENVSSGTTPKVTVDGVEIPAPALSAPRAVDPGHHVVAVSSGAGDFREAAVDVQEGESKDVLLDVSPTVSSAQDETQAGPSSVAWTSNPWRLASYIGFGVGGAGLVAGSITGLFAISDLSSAKKQGCVGNQCPPSAYPELDKAGTLATVSTVAFIVAGVGAGAGVLGFILGKKKGAPPPENATPSLSLYFGPLPTGSLGGPLTELGAGVRGRF
jgi:hypothetical protein